MSFTRISNAHVGSGVQNTPVQSEEDTFMDAHGKLYKRQSLSDYFQSVGIIPPNHSETEEEQMSAHEDEVSLEEIKAQHRDTSQDLDDSELYIEEDADDVQSNATDTFYVPSLAFTLDDDRSEQVQSFALHAQCAPEDVVVTALDWYLELVNTNKLART